MTDLEGCIGFWKSKLKDRLLLEPSAAAIIELTVRFLEKLKDMLEEKVEEEDHDTG